MSSLYNLEPQPTASLILHTTSGDLSFELFAQQTPLTSRNFIQHCLDGYYDNTIFHRLVPGFIIQGGDPTGTGHGGESIYDGGALGEPREEGGVYPLDERKGRNAPGRDGGLGVGFKDEFHSRLKFNRRGLLGMANEGEKDSNGSQFFLTLGVAEELTGRNTLFGRVAGDTIYNLVRWGEGEVGENERPVYPVKVLGAEVLVNPFEGMVRRVKELKGMVGDGVGDGGKGGKRKGKRKVGKQLLSFGAEDGDGVEDGGPLVKKTKFDTRIVMEVDSSEAGEKPRTKETAEQPSKEVKKKEIKKPVSLDSSPESPPAPIPKQIPNRAAKVDKRNISLSPEPEPVQKVSSLLDRTNAQIAELKASMRRNIQVAPIPEKKKSALESLIPATSVRGRKRHPGGNAAPTTTDQRALDILKAFREKLEQAPPEKEAVKESNVLVEGDTGDKDDAVAADDDEASLCDLHFIANCQSCKSWDAQDDNAADDADDDDGIAWMSHALSFKEDKLGKDLRYRKKAEEELVVIDPREKARTLKEEVRAKREARAGGSGREWDRERNEKLARQSALAGRGAK